MKLTLFAHELDAATSWAAKLAPRSPAIPVLAAVLLEAGETLQFSATDFETFATGTISAATIGKPGKLAVSASLLAAVAKTLPATAEVSLESAGRGLSLRCGRYRATLPEVPADDWPPFPEIGPELGQVTGPVLSRALARVLPVVPPVSEKVQLTGVLFDTADMPTLIGSDGCRMAAASLDWQPVAFDNDQPALEPLIIPASLLRSADDGVNGGTVTVHSDVATLTLRTATHTVTGRLIAGRYPGNWRTLLDAPVANLATSVTVDVAALRLAVEQVSAVSDASAKTPELIRLAIGENSIGVSIAGTAKADVAKGEGATEVDVYSMTGEPITVGTVATFILDALRGLGSPMATLEFTGDAMKPFLLTPADDEGEPIEDGYRHLIVPRRIAELI